MVPNLFRPLIEVAKEDVWISLGLLLLLTVVIATLFARKSTPQYFWGLLMVLGRSLAAPVRFISHYTAMTHSQDKVDTLPWISRRAPLTMANLSFISSFSAFSGILLLAATVLLAGRTWLPDPNIGKEIKAVKIRKEIAQGEQASAQNLLSKIRAAGSLDQMGRNGVYAEVGKSWIALLQQEQAKLKEEIELDPMAKAELARATGELPSPSNIDYYNDRLDRFRFHIKNPYFRNLINTLLSLNSRIQHTRTTMAPVIYEWQNDRRYQEMLNLWETTSKLDPSAASNEELAQLEASNHFNWSPMLLALSMGLVTTWLWIWICGIGVEFLNLLLGHFEWVKQMHEDSGSRTGNITKTNQVMHQAVHAMQATSAAPASQKCLHCGAQLDAKAAFCEICGKNVR